MADTKSDPKHDSKSAKQSAPSRNEDGRFTDKADTKSSKSTGSKPASKADDHRVKGR